MYFPHLVKWGSCYDHDLRALKKRGACYEMAVCLVVNKKGI